MLSVETFKRISKLSKRLEEHEMQEEFYSEKQEESLKKFVDYMDKNYNMVKVYESNENWHFELHPKYK